jgi:hypothetical protein
MHKRRLWGLMDNSNRVIVIKARQVGISTAVRAWQFHRAFTSPNPETYAVLSFHDRSARNLRRMDRRWLQELPGPLQRELTVDSAEDTIFTDTLAGFSSFTTGGRGGTRSFEFTGAHLSEFAFYTDPDEVLAQSVSTVGNGPLIIESTVNVPGDAFHRLIEGAPDNGWTVLTYWWWQHEATTATTDCPRASLLPNKKRPSRSGTGWTMPNCGGVGNRSPRWGHTSSSASIRAVWTMPSCRGSVRTSTRGTWTRSTRFGLTLHEREFKEPRG